MRCATAFASLRVPSCRSAGGECPSIFPFGTTTGRNAHSKSLYNAHAGMRGFMLFAPDRVGGYLDWRTQEVGVAAAKSGDARTDRRLPFRRRLPRARAHVRAHHRPDPVRWKNENPGVRHQMKGIQLGINYGMGVPSLARGLDRHPVIASEIIERHKRRYPPYWQWRENAVQSRCSIGGSRAATAGRST